jgi:hypothetical protein
MKRKFVILFAAALIALASVLGVTACGGGAQKKVQEAKQQVEKKAKEAKQQAGKQAKEARQQAGKKMQQGKQKVGRNGY